MPYDTALTPEDEVAFIKAFPDPRSTVDYDMRGAWKSGATKSANGHLPDTWKKPNHITFSDESMYNGVDGHMGGKWEALPNKKWKFTAGPANLQSNDAATLQNYFKKYEAGNTLVLPPVSDPMAEAIKRGLYPQQAVQ